MIQNSKTGAAFIAGGSLAGVGVSAAVGGMGLAGGFGAVGIGTAPVVGAGAVVGAAVYGAFKAVAVGDAAAFGAMGIGAVGGVGFSSVVGGMGLVAPKIGLAFGIGTLPMAGVGAVLGLAAYGFAKLLDESEVKESPAQLFERMEAKVLQMDDYNAAVIELGLFLSGEDLKQKFAALEVEEELQALKTEFSTVNNESKTVTSNLEIPETWKCVKTLQGHLARVNAIAITPDGKTLVSGSDDRQINLWNLQTGKWLYTFSGQAEAVLSLAISPDSKILASSTHKTIKLWHIPTGNLLQTLPGCSPITFTPDGKMLVSGGNGGSINIWSLQGLKELNLDSLLHQEWWEVLGVDSTAHSQDVKLAYLQLARQYHPDINSSANAKAAMQRINEAYRQFQAQLKF
ncbi:DnaJ domain-containing protein [Nostoc sp. FACHB-110]|uniref:DnaJ domain-containing protein n=1 Tax=Nostoc sp. FACHB-110 TaxID=2692834 RepID=UPI0016893B74|nr:DnaJ domain-containing protein [Nostoc sp. FACHB-110]MBD2440327.1 DnaJ domain-containing protein [Nostoc sp. FACHB-110]